VRSQTEFGNEVEARLGASGFLANAGQTWVVIPLSLQV